MFRILGLLALLLLLATPAAQAQWTHLGADLDGEATVDYSGQSVSLDGDCLDGDCLDGGAPFPDGAGADAEHARVYEWTGTAWRRACTSSGYRGRRVSRSPGP